MIRTRYSLALIALASLLAVGALLAGFAGVIDPATAAAVILAEGPVAVDMEAIKTELKRIGDDVKGIAEKALKEAQTNSEVSAKTKETADKLLTDQGTLKERLDKLEQKVAKQATDDSAGKDLDTLDGALEKVLEPLKAFKATPNQNGQLNIPISRKALTNTGTTGTALNYPGTQLLSTPLVPLLRRLYIRDLLAPGRISTGVAFYQRESGFTNNAAMVSEGSLKPTSELTFELVTEPVRTIAHTFDVSLQMLDDIPYLQSYIGQRGMYGLKLVEDTQLLTGSGAGQNIEGIYTAATAYAAPAGATINGQPAGGANENDIDKLRLALLQVELADAFADAMVLHPTDWAGIELLKDTQNQYLFVNVVNMTEPRLWGRRIVSTRAMTQGRFLVGDFRAHAQILDRQDANIAISFENKDNFVRNMATIRVEERLALAIYRPEAFVKGTLESAS